ncbi:hypothetical protein [Vibrio sp. UCD-FRSSP16_30]|uniref:hypothetical protein n=1 Tax=unclassified Vibrio TaxID=2614977 RepID=UPI0035A1D270
MTELSESKAQQLCDKLKEQHSYLLDCHLAPEAGRGGMLLLSIDKTKPHQGSDIIKAALEIFSNYTAIKFVIVCDDDVNVRDWNDVIWAITTRMDPSRDSLFIEGEHSQLSISQLGIDATNKLGSEATREWGRPIHKDKHLVARIDSIWDKLDIL